MNAHDYNNRKNIAGKRIKEARKRKNLSQNQLAVQMQLAGISIKENGISCIEHGNRTIYDYELQSFAKVLGVSVDWLLEAAEIQND